MEVIKDVFVLYGQGGNLYLLNNLEMFTFSNLLSGW